MPKKPDDSPKRWIDPDDGQEWTEEMFDRAVLTDGGKVIPRKMGRPKLATPKQLVTLRLDAEVVAGFRAGGAGWQSRMNAALLEAIGGSVRTSNAGRKPGSSETAAKRRGNSSKPAVGSGVTKRDGRTALQSARAAATAERTGKRQA